ncbi:MAG: DUF4365 domain-containing protein [Bacteroidales bacterium]|nr:DUF4365 domain-containing protein [Bacteroidales bacterium]
MADNNAIGDRGESIFHSRITEHYLFNVYFLGEKAPIVDFLLEIIDSKKSYFFMVQVKSTEKGYDSSGNLKVKVSKRKYGELLKRPMPTYVAGVDNNSETVYLCSAFGDKKSLNSMPIKHVLKQSKKATSKKTLELLKQDVITYWENSKTKSYKKKFKSSL